MKKFIVSATAMAAACLLSTAASAQNVGDWVLSQWQDSTQYFPGVVVASSGQQVTVRFDDGTTENRLASSVRPYNWRVGSRITCRWTDGNWYDATIEGMGADGMTLNVRYDADGVRQRTNTGRCRTRG
jgi:hypothetical protein